MMTEPTVKRRTAAVSGRARTRDATLVEATRRVVQQLAATIQLGWALHRIARDGRPIDSQTINRLVRRLQGTPANGRRAGQRRRPRRADAGELGELGELARATRRRTAKPTTLPVSS